jgi:hypothetical protein
MDFSFESARFRGKKKRVPGQDGKGLSGATGLDDS